MTTTEQLRAERAELYRQRTVQYELRGAALDAASAAGAAEGDPLPEPLQRAYDAYTAEIGRLNGEIAELDEQIATEEEQNR
ncbi:hypothetical protein [Mycobacterium avium]|uniref:hypothetical protein n=1 Tax=Mycobacterium avium TaxID=1764 RepID=UPI001CC38738|nr:hypothetical protein [Mycobacterium avium]MBZ4620505.1 hypothetical protein [Mycobacterium avium subsp. hominissuis]